MGDGFGNGAGRRPCWRRDETVVKVADGIETSGGGLKRNVLHGVSKVARAVIAVFRNAGYTNGLIERVLVVADYVY